MSVCRVFIPGCITSFTGSCFCFYGDFTADRRATWQLVSGDDVDMLAYHPSSAFFLMRSLRTSTKYTCPGIDPVTTANCSQRYLLNRLSVASHCWWMDGVNCITSESLLGCNAVFTHV